jgi:hypothetical protein
MKIGLCIYNICSFFQLFLINPPCLPGGHNNNENLSCIYGRFHPAMSHNCMKPTSRLASTTDDEKFVSLLIKGRSGESFFQRVFS